MKKTLLKIFILIVFFSVPLITNAEEVSVSKINSDFVRVRTGAGTNNPILQFNNTSVQLFRNHAVEILSESKDASDITWYRINFTYSSQTLTGFVRHDFITTETYKIENMTEFENSLRNQGFPESYFEPLKKLKAMYPNWKFEALNTNLNWNSVVDAQSVVGKSLIHSSRDVSYRSTEQNAYNWDTDRYILKDGSSWYAANRSVVAYYLDPRNFLTQSTVMMFEQLSYNKTYHTEQAVQRVLNNTFMSGSYSYDGKTISYAKTFIEAAEKTNASPLHLASRVRLEQGTNGSAAVSGAQFEYNGKTYSNLYNFFNIGAYSHAEAWKLGLIYANGGADGPGTGPRTIYNTNVRTDAGTTFSVLNHNGTQVVLSGGTQVKILSEKRGTDNYIWYHTEFSFNNTTLRGYIRSDLITDTLSYNRPWDNRYKSIIGGSEFVAHAYINRGQDTLYLQKFNVSPNAYYSLHTHQYMTNVEAPRTEGIITYNAYNNFGVLDNELTFVIPVYNNMPNSTSLPTLLGNPNNYLKDIKIDNKSISNFNRTNQTYNINVSTNTSSVKVEGVLISSKASIISNTNSVQLNNNTTKVEIRVRAENNQVRTYTINLIKSDSTPTSTNDILNNFNWREMNNNIAGIKLNTQISTLQNNLPNDSALKILDRNKKVKTSGIIGTGDIIQLTSNNETIEKNALIYGDVNGDGKTDIVDLLLIQRHILNTSKLNNVYSLAADINKDGNITIVDLLHTQRHILGTQTIKQ